MSIIIITSITINLDMIVTYNITSLKLDYLVKMFAKRLKVSLSK